jgi:Uma2 family endonuclease
MNIALLKFMNVDEYLAWGEADGDGLRTELINGQIVAMSPEQADHNRIKLATAIALETQSDAQASRAKFSSMA